MVAVLWFSGLPALAQAPAGDEFDEPVMFNADPVLVAQLLPEDPDSEVAQADAARIQALLLARFERGNVVVHMADVPRFQPHNYDAATYLSGCPPGRYAGCILVLGQRAEVDRAVGATVRREVDEFDDKQTVLVMTVHVVDVAESREVATFSMPVSADKEADTIEGFARLFDEIVRGDFEYQDERNAGETDADRAAVQERNARIAASIDELEDRLGLAVRDRSVATTVTPKLTVADLAQFADREDKPPWQRLGMREAEYVKYRNSGLDLDQWRQEGWGRFGRILGRIGVGAGNGPWHQSYNGDVLLSDTTLQPVNAVQVLEVVNARSSAADFEVGFGALPFLDVMLVASVRTGQTRYLIDEDVQNQVAVPGRETRYGMSSWQYGSRVQLAPFAHWPARPTVGVGIARWSGRGIPASDRFDRLEAPNATFLEILPGIEVDAHENLGLSLRVLESVPLGGSLVRRTETGTPLMPDPPRATGERGPGISLQASLLFRLPPLFGRPAPRSFVDDEDEPL